MKTGLHIHIMVIWVITINSICHLDYIQLLKYKLSDHENRNDVPVYLNWNGSEVPF